MTRQHLLRIAALGGSRALAAALGFLAVGLAARSLSPAELGLWSMALALHGYAMHLSELGLRSVVTVEVSHDRSAFRHLLPDYLGMRLGAVLVLSGLLLALVAWLVPQLLAPLAFACISLVAVALHLDWLALSTDHTLEAGLLLLVRPLAMLTLLSAIHIESAAAMAACYALAWWLAAAASWPALRHRCRASAPMPGPAVPSRWRMLRLGWPLMAVSLTSHVQLSLDLLVVGMVFGMEDAGQYYLAAAIAGAGLVLANAMGQLAMARMAPLRDDPAGFRRSLMHELRLVGLLVLFGACLMAALTPWLVPLAFGNAFAEAARLLPWLLPWVVLQSLSTVAQGALTAGRRQRLLLAGNLGLAAALALGLPLAAISGSLVAFALCRAVAELARLSILLAPFAGPTMRSLSPDAHGALEEQAAAR